ncbi:MAG: tyrosine--tRNA ligase [Minisyncoccia bacterium]|jgi:tyrosyl-tRNA synthetase
MKADGKQNDIILNRGVEEIIEKDNLSKALTSGKKLRVKLGIDPTAPDIHLGHTVPLRKLRQFQEAGHQIVLIIGDFTGMIGDPSGRNEARKPLTEKEIKTNLKKYLGQAGKVLDIKKVEVRYNSEWHKKEGLTAMLEMARAATFQQIIKRADFQKRIDAGEDITLVEILYPLLQGYDSVKIKADVEIGGTDQKFNLLMGRRVQRHFGQPEQDILTVPLIEGTDGVRKMSKSYGNYIGLDEKPEEMFGKLMSVPDPLINKYFELLTDVDAPGGNPYRAKMLLAETIVGMYHSPTLAEKAKENWIKTFSKKEIPDNARIEKVSKDALSSGTLATLFTFGDKSRSEWRRLFSQEAIEVNEKTATDPIEKRKDGDIIRIGKHDFRKIKSE